MVKRRRRSSTEQLRAVAAFVFAKDWHEARALAASDPWLSSTEADAAFGALVAELERVATTEVDATPLTGAIAMIRERLARSRTQGFDDAFADLEELDRQFLSFDGLLWVSDLYEVLRTDPSLMSDVAIDELRLLVERTASHDGVFDERLSTMLAVLNKARDDGLDSLRGAVEAVRAEAIRQAAAVAAKLGTIPPAQATPAMVAECEQALALVHHQAGSPLWHDLHGLLGSFLLELRDGDRPSNVARARRAYEAILDWERDHGVEPSARGVCGYVNCLTADPNTDPAELRRALVMLDDVLDRLRRTDDARTLVTAITVYVSALAAARDGDPDQRTERSLELVREQIRVLGSAETFPVLWGRAHHNLGSLYANRRSRARSQDIDDAKRAFETALSVRTREADPAGRARTLRALALVIRDWSGAESQAAADAMADEYQREADEIAGVEPRAAPRPPDWARLAGEESALGHDLDSYKRLPRDEGIALLEPVIAHHRGTIATLSKEKDPATWASWMGALGQLLAARGHLDPTQDTVAEAYDALRRAVDAAPASQLRLRRDLYRATGEFAHQFAQWHIAFPAFASALAISDVLFAEVAAPETRRKELEDMRGLALFGAYAAARVGALDHAIALAEQARSRDLADAWAAAHIGLGSAPPDARTAVTSAWRRVLELEQVVTDIRSTDATVVAEKMRGRLADAIGAPPELLQMRLTNRADTEDTSADFLRIAPELHAARTHLREALEMARAESAAVLPDRLDAAAIVTLAARLECPIVYALATVYGAATIIVSPDGRLDVLLEDELTSDVTGALVYGREGSPGFAAGAMTGDVEKLGPVLPVLLDTLRDGIMEAVVQWLNERGYERAVLIPLGRLGLLPLHAAVASDTPAFAYAPSAKALAVALTARERAVEQRASLLAVGDPVREETMSLPFAVAEVRVVERLTSWSAVTSLVGSQASLQAVLHGAESASHLLFACHAEYRASDPMDSALLLANDDRITLRMLLRSAVRPLVARMVVLSACQTANVESRTLPDEVLGLPSGFLLTGVPGVVATMWLVDDRAAALFSMRLWDELIERKREPTLAVAMTQRWLRAATAAELMVFAKRMRQAVAAAGDEPDPALSMLWRDLAGQEPTVCPFAGPEYWAAFTYIGC